jgi:hypothetical protein
VESVLWEQGRRSGREAEASLQIAEQHALPIWVAVLVDVRWQIYDVYYGLVTDPVEVHPDEPGGQAPSLDAGRLLDDGDLRKLHRMLIKKNRLRHRSDGARRQSAVRAAQ